MHRFVDGTNADAQLFGRFENDFSHLTRLFQNVCLPKPDYRPAFSLKSLGL